MDMLDILKIFKKPKEISTLEFDKQDIIYQVWELGVEIGEIAEVCWIIKLPIRGKFKKEGFLIGKAINSLGTLEALYKDVFESKTLTVIEDIGKEIREMRNKISLKEFNPGEIQSQLEYWQGIIESGLKTKSIHLFHIFLLGVNLKKLATRLIYDLHSEEIESLIQDNIELIEKVEKGDKVLNSPNLEISKQNLRVIKLRLKGFKTHISTLRYYSKKNSYKITSELVKRINIWTELILDIRNLSDCLPLWQRCIIATVPFLICLYMGVIIGVIIINLVAGDFSGETLRDFPEAVRNIPQTLQKISVKEKFIELLGIPLLILLIYVLVSVYRKINDMLLRYGFRFKISQFSSYPALICYGLQLSSRIKRVWTMMREIIIKPRAPELELLNILDIKDIKEKDEIPLFNCLSVEEVKKVLSKLKSRSYKEGEIIIQEGEEGDYFHILKAGKVNINVKEHCIANLNKRWDFFGEISLLSGGERVATVKAVTNVETACLDRQSFNELLKESPSTAANLARILILRTSELYR